MNAEKINHLKGRILAEINCNGTERSIRQCVEDLASHATWLDNRMDAVREQRDAAYRETDELRKKIDRMENDNQIFEELENAKIEIVALRDANRKLDAANLALKGRLAAEKALRKTDMTHFEKEYAKLKGRIKSLEEVEMEIGTLKFDFEAQKKRMENIELKLGHTAVVTIGGGGGGGGSGLVAVGGGGSDPTLAGLMRRNKELHETIAQLDDRITNLQKENRVLRRVLDRRNKEVMHLRRCITEEDDSE